MYSFFLKVLATPISGRVNKLRRFRKSGVATPSLTLKDAVSEEGIGAATAIGEDGLGGGSASAARRKEDNDTRKLDKDKALMQVSPQLNTDSRVGSDSIFVSPLANSILSLSWSLSSVRLTSVSC